MNIVLVGLYRYRNFNIRIMHPLLKEVKGISPHTIYFKNCEINQFSNPTPKEERLFADTIKTLRPKLVGFSVLSFLFPIASRLTAIVKSIDPSIIVIWGGIQPTIAPEDCLYDGADMLCIGEGEGAMMELVERLRDNKPYNDIQNLWIMNGRHWIKNPMRPLIEDLNALPHPAYNQDSFYFIDHNRITLKDPLLNDNCLWVQTSRGCPFTCSYCVNSVLRPMYKGLGNFIRRRSVDNVINEIKAYLSIPNNKASYIFFMDEVFATQNAWIDEFCLKYKQEINLPFFIDYMPEVLSIDNFDKLVKVGLNKINLGIQSTSDAIRNEIFNRPGKRDKILEAVKSVLAKGINLKLDLIFNNPYETPETLLDGIDFLLRLPQNITFTPYALQFFPRYALTKKALAENIISIEDIKYYLLYKQTSQEIVFLPKLFPYLRKQVLQNILWLVIYHYEDYGLIRYAVFTDTVRARLCLVYLNIKAVILGMFLGYGRGIWRSAWLYYFIRGVKYLFKGDWIGLLNKAKVLIKK